MPTLIRNEKSVMKRTTGSCPGPSFGIAMVAARTRTWRSARNCCLPPSAMGPTLLGSAPQNSSAVRGNIVRLKWLKDDSLKNVNAPATSAQPHNKDSNRVLRIRASPNKPSLDARGLPLREVMADQARAVQRQRNDYVGQYSGNIHCTTKVVRIGSRQREKPTPPAMPSGVR